MQTSDRARGKQGAGREASGPGKNCFLGVSARNRPLEPCSAPVQQCFGPPPYLGTQAKWGAGYYYL